MDSYGQLRRTGYPYTCKICDYKMHNKELTKVHLAKVHNVHLDPKIKSMAEVFREEELFEKQRIEQIT